MNMLGMTGLQWAIWAVSNSITGAALLFTAGKLAWDRHRGAIPPDRALFEVTATVAAGQYLVRPWMLHASLFWPLVWVSAVTAGICIAIGWLVARGWRWPD